VYVEGVHVEEDFPAPLPDYSPDGVDLTLIRWFLSFTPAERMQYLQERITSILAIREHVKR
jgi:hypothetical protein